MLLLSTFRLPRTGKRGVLRGAHPGVASAAPSRERDSAEPSGWSIQPKRSSKYTCTPFFSALNEVIMDVFSHQSI